MVINKATAIMASLENCEMAPLTPIAFDADTLLVSAKNTGNINQAAYTTRTIRVTSSGLFDNKGGIFDIILSSFYKIQSLEVLAKPLLTPFSTL